MVLTGGGGKVEGIVAAVDGGRRDAGRRADAEDGCSVVFLRSAAGTAEWRGGSSGVRP